jgi:NitT/TauT family transport system substrate-binding protein
MMNELHRSISRRLLLGGMAGAAAALPFAPRPARAQSAKQVTFLFDVPAYSKHALFYPAVENGYFRKAGLEVAIHAGKGSSDVAQRIATKSAQFGFVDAGTAILARGRGLPVKLTSMVHYKNLMAVVGFADPPLNVPKDIEGRKLAATAGDSVRFALPALAKINSFDMGKVEFVTVESPQKRGLLLAGKVDGVCDSSVNFPVYAAGAKKMGREVRQILFADWGVDVYSNGILVHDEFLKAEPDTVRAFNNALVEAMIFAVDHRDEAVKIFLKYNPTFDPELVRAGLDVAIEHLLVPEVREHGVGPMSAGKMQETIALMKGYFDLQHDVAPGDIYTNDFVTAGRKPATI